MVDGPIRVNGGVKGFGFEFPSSVKTSHNTPEGLRVTPDPDVPTIKIVEIWNQGALLQRIEIEGEWEILFLT